VAMVEDGIVLIERGNPPYGLALPGGFAKYAKSLEESAKEELKEETGLIAEQLELIGVYSEPSQDPRKHIISVAYSCIATGTPIASDDAKALHILPPKSASKSVALQHHKRIILDYLGDKNTKSPTC
ncbi:NUDIX hydrolase, partial [Candidatus Woesearchaeota archaeon]|nr:NUDIX hydrolase [Candidatus Woesearchaeota archaeon]